MEIKKVFLAARSLAPRFRSASCKNIVTSLVVFAGKILDVVLPRRARRVRAEALGLENIPVSPASREMHKARVTTLMDYKEPLVEDLIRSLKYDGSSRAANLCAEVLADFLREEIEEARAFSPREILLVPVPLHASRKRERGFNQIEIVLKRLPKEFRDGTVSTLAPEALERTRATQQQTHLSRDERVKNVAGAFEVTDKNLLNAHIFLIDDVVTTGATLTNAAHPLEQAGATVALLALARA